MTRKGKPVRCIETGEVFPNAKVASLSMGMTKGAVTQVVQGYTPTARGFHWEYVNKEHRPLKPHKQAYVPSVKAKAPRPRTAPRMTIPEVLAEAKRRTAMTGRYTRYADIQKEETVQLIRDGKLCKKPKQ